MSEEPNTNGNVIAWRVNQLELAHREHRAQVERIEQQVNELKVKMASWAAGGAGGAVVVTELIKFLVGKGG